MRRNKMIAKVCPKCQKQIPVACKNCHCGHSFYKKTNRGVSPSFDLLKLFVTNQRKREKPNFYDSLVYDKQLKKQNKVPLVIDPPPPSSSSNEDIDDVKKECKKRMLKQKEENYEELVTKLSEDKALNCKIILNELNRKIKLVSWKPFE